MKTALYIKAAKPVSVNAEPLGTSEFAGLMENFSLAAVSSPIAVAVSGGPDSMALAFCVQRWIDEKNGGKLLALIVDHGLRQESNAEAKQTLGALAKIGIAAEILNWQHPPVVSRLHETARRARYRLLTEACRQKDIGHLLLAHHSQDQAETILMRLAKGSGIDGLAGMPSQNLINGVRVLRPFLGVAKERLMATCEVASVPFVSDPSNDSLKFARGRLRKILPLLTDEGFTVESLNDLGMRAGEAKAALDHAAAALLRVATKLDDGGTIQINLEQLRSAPRAIVRRVLAHCLQSIHHEDYLPEHAALTRLLDALIADGPTPSSTLHGCFISKGEVSCSIMREYAAITDAPQIEPGATVLWDGRWNVSLSNDAGRSFIIQPLGNPPHEILDQLAPGLRRQIPQGRIRSALPSLWFNGALALIPTLPCCKYQADAHAESVVNWPSPLVR